MKTGADLLAFLASQVGQQSSDAFWCIESVCRASITAVLRCSAYSAQYWLKQLIATHPSVDDQAQQLLQCMAVLHLFDLASSGAVKCSDLIGWWRVSHQIQPRAELVCQAQPSSRTSCMAQAREQQLIKDRERADSATNLGCEEFQQAWAAIVQPWLASPAADALYARHVTVATARAAASASALAWAVQAAVAVCKKRGTDRTGAADTYGNVLTSSACTPPTTDTAVGQERAESVVGKCATLLVALLSQASTVDAAANQEASQVLASVLASVHPLCTNLACSPRASDRKVAADSVLVGLLAVAARMDTHGMQLHAEQVLEMAGLMHRSADAGATRGS